MPTDHSRDVFINCPFDESYAPMLRAIVFAVVDCGFVPRCALERVDASEIRIIKIFQTIGECPFGVHDISRVQLDAATELPRFNMPLELGIFLGAKFLGDQTQRTKTCLVFDEHPHRYQKYLSDVSGQDISWHSNDPRIVVRHVRNWLSTVSGTDMPTAAYVWDHYQAFSAELLHQCVTLRQRPDELTYADLMRHIGRFKSNYLESLSLGGRNEANLTNPDAVAIRKAIRDLDRNGAAKSAFVILSKGASGLTYMQAFRHDADSWAIEYQHGHLDEHYEGNVLVSASQLETKMIAYLHAEDSWHSGMEWIKIDVHS